MATATVATRQNGWDIKYHKQVIGKGTTPPILMYAMAKDGRLTSTNQDAWITTDTDLADGLYQIVGKQWLPVKGAEVDEFPPVPTLKKVATFDITLDPVAHKRALACASTDKTRYVLTGVLMEVVEDGIVWVATDGQRLTVFKQEQKVPTKAIGKYILPHGSTGKPSSNLLNLLLKDKKHPVVRVTVTGEAMIVFDTLDQTITAKLVDGTYPNYKQVIPNDNPGLLRVDCGTMQAALKELKPFISDDSRAVKITIMAKHVRMYVTDPDRGIEHTVDVPCDHLRRVKDMQPLGLALPYLLDSTAYPDGPLYLGYNDNLSPMCFGNKVDGEQMVMTDLTVQMSMRLD